MGRGGGAVGVGVVVVRIKRRRYIGREFLKLKTIVTPTYGQQRQLEGESI